MFLLSVVASLKAFRSLVSKVGESSASEKKKVVKVKGIFTLLDPVGASQGSVLGPLCFTCYSNPIGGIVRLLPLKLSHNADNSQIAFINFRVFDDMDKTLVYRLRWPHLGL